MVADQYSGGDRQQVMIAELTRVFQRKEVAEWLEFFEGQDVCVTPVLDLGDAVHDEHLRDRETIVADKHAEMGTLPQVGVFPKLSATPGDIGAEAPALGRHTAEALKSVGFNDKTVKELLRSKAVRQAD
jgi:crotonobetainyl-CoA:carnitine CoA-transferase CaiB-like acyl-CoA transferase